MDPSKLASLVKAMRVISWILAMALMGLAVVNDAWHRLFPFGVSLMAFSAGMAFSESWISKKLALVAGTD